MFDCWNSVACAIDPPYEEFREKKIIEGKEADLLYQTKVDIFNSKASMTINRIFKNSQEEYLNLDNLTLWSPRIITEILTINDIYVEDVLNFRNFNEKAKNKDHRILFIGRKK